MDGNVNLSKHTDRTLLLQSSLGQNACLELQPCCSNISAVRSRGQGGAEREGEPMIELRRNIVKVNFKVDLFKTIKGQALHKINDNWLGLNNEHVLIDHTVA